MLCLHCGLWQADNVIGARWYTPNSGWLRTLMLSATVASCANVVNGGQVDNPRAVLPAAHASPILVGVEYALISNRREAAEQATALAALGARAAKHYPEHAQWGEMQKSPDAAIDFSRLDAFVSEFQRAGFTNLVICLKSNSPWASKQAGKLITTNPAPKPQYLEAYAHWIYSVVERYDGDGKDDMPGLLHPVRFYEIGSEFSSYEPEPTADYLAMLARAYRAAHRAYDKVIVAHAAFLTTNAFRGNPSPAQYPAAFAAVPRRIMHHSLADMRQILDHPDLFDAVNFHALGDPDEIEPMVRWLKYEMQRRGYSKPFLISDTATSPFIAWGPATTCRGNPNQLGIIVPPAVEADRCRLADYFTRLVDGDLPTLRWTQGFAAEDMVKKVVIAAEQGAMLIDTAFIEDLSWLKLKVFRAGAGTAAWSGMVDLKRNERRPAFYALQQLLRHLKGNTGIRRLPVGGESLRVYELSFGGRRAWIAWLDPGKLILPGDPVPTRGVDLPVGAATVAVEPLITRFGQSAPERIKEQTNAGMLHIVLSPTPVFVD